MRRWVDDMSSYLLDSNTSHILSMLRSGFPPSTPIKAHFLGEESIGKTYCAHIAAEKGLLPVVRLLAEMSPEVLEARNSYGLTPFLCACKSSEFDTIRFLATRAKVDLSATDSKGNTAVHLAAAEGHKDLVEYLIEGLKMSPLGRNHYGELPLDTCVRSGQKADIYKQAALEETAAYLKSKCGVSLSPDPVRAKKQGDGSKTKGTVTPVRKAGSSGENPGLNLRSVTPVDRLIRDRCKAVYTTVQNRLLQKAPVLRRNRPSRSLHAHLLRFPEFSPVRGTEPVTISPL